jgi:hypothetical protein
VKILVVAAVLGRDLVWQRDDTKIAKQICAGPVKQDKVSHTDKESWEHSHTNIGEGMQDLGTNITQKKSTPQSPPQVWTPRGMVSLKKKTACQVLYVHGPKKKVGAGRHNKNLDCGNAVWRMN